MVAINKRSAESRWALVAVALPVLSGGGSSGTRIGSGGGDNLLLGSNLMGGLSLGAKSSAGDGFPSSSSASSSASLRLTGSVGSIVSKLSKSYTRIEPRVAFQRLKAPEKSTEVMRKISEAKQFVGGDRRAADRPASADREQRRQARPGGRQDHGPCEQSPTRRAAIATLETASRASER